MMRHSFARCLVGFLLVSLGIAACNKATDVHLAYEEDEGGIIGTGILGTITDIGSIYVNGVRVVYDDDLMVETAFGDVSPKRLRPGDTVAVEAFPKGDELRATSIQRYRPVVAPVEKIALDRGWIRALGVQIGINKGAVLLSDEKAVDWRSLKIGDWIAVDGLWRADEVVASNVRRIPPSKLAAIRGVAGLDDEEGLEIAGVPVAGIDPAALEIGGVIAVRGGVEQRTGGSVLLARQFALPEFSPGVSRLIVEGFTSEPTSSGAYTVFGSGLTSFADDPTNPMTTRRSLFCGKLDGVFDIETATLLPADGGQRQKPGHPFVIDNHSGRTCQERP